MIRARIEYPTHHNVATIRGKLRRIGVGIKCAATISGLPGDVTTAIELQHPGSETARAKGTRTTRHDVAAIGGRLNGEGRVTISSTIGLLPGNVAGRIQLQ